jgi:hypothetical protein
MALPFLEALLEDCKTLSQHAPATLLLLTPTQCGRPGSRWRHKRQRSWMARHLLDASCIPSCYDARLAPLLPSQKALRLSQNVTQRLHLGMRPHRLLLFHLCRYAPAAGVGLERRSICLVKCSRSSATGRRLRLFGTLLSLWYAPGKHECWVPPSPPFRMTDACLQNGKAAAMA